MSERRNKTQKLQECVGHAPGNVNCISFGRKSGRVMATGGDDKKVNLWAVGKPNSIMSLSGHSACVDCVEFDSAENRCAAGSRSGAIRIWDLEQAKVIRALSGHKSAISCLDFHPSSNYIVSGSTDSSIKLWDIERKACILTLKGHSGSAASSSCSAPITSIQFSPNGEWVCAGGEDGIIRLWDLHNSSKQLAEFTEHAQGGGGGAVNCVLFHPKVLLLASCANDRTVHIYDLERFALSEATSPAQSAQPIRSLVFHPDGNCLYAASGDYLKVYQTEPLTQLETVPVGWGNNVQSLVIAPTYQELIGGATSNPTNNGGVISTYLVDTKLCAPFYVAPPSSSSSVTPSATPSSAQPDDNSERPFTAARAAGGGERGGAADPPMMSSNLSARKLFAASSNQNAPPGNLKAVMADQQAGGGGEGGNGRERASSTTSGRGGVLVRRSPIEEEAGGATGGGGAAAGVEIQDASEYLRVFKPNRALNHSPISEIEAAHAAVNTAKSNDVVSSARPSQPKQTQQQQQPDTFRMPTANQKPTVAPANGGGVATAGGGGAPPDVAAPPGLEDCSDLLKPQKAGGAAQPDAGNVYSAEEARRILKDSHSPIADVLQKRHRLISSIRLLWSPTNVMHSFEYCLAMQDASVLVDLLSVLSENPNILTLDLSCCILPHLVKLVSSKHSNHIEVACSVTKVILKTFSPLIRDNVLGNAASKFVDISREERFKKCSQCFSNLQRIHQILSDPGSSASNSPLARELLVMLGLLSN